MVRIGVLTSSRADFGVYLPLLRALKKDMDLFFEIIAFGSHLSSNHGHTIDEIEQSGFEVKHKIPTIMAVDSEEAIATSAALTQMKFASFWANHKNDFDIILCLGDRYEMFAAVIAGVPFNIKFAHLYGGDVSLGSIDNVYRNCLTHSSVLHFPSTKKCASRIERIMDENNKCEVIGILSLDDINKIKLYTINEFYEKWKIDLNLPTILITFHPETVNSRQNFKYAKVIYDVINDIQKKYQIVITMPNADTNGSVYRKKFIELKNKYSKSIHLIENFGVQSYFSCMKYSQLMVGNTSSGISEAASFEKYFINVGNRQKGREFGENIVISEFNKIEIIDKIEKTIRLGNFKGENIYLKNGSIENIINKIKIFLSEYTQ